MMRVRPIALPFLACVLVFGVFGSALSQTARAQSDMTALQRLDLMISKLAAMRRSLNSAIAGIPQKAQEKNKKADPEDPRVRLQGLEKEVGSILSEVNDLHGKQERSEKYDPSQIDSLETSVKELDGRIQTALQATASARTGKVASSNSGSSAKSDKKGLRKLWPFGGGPKKGEYDDVLSTVAPGRDRELFQDAAKEVRKGDHETGRLLFTTIITTYPDSPFLPLAKLAIADSFYLEGGTSSLVQAAASYQDWLTFFPTDPLADAAMLKVAESEMRQMGLSDRDVTHARKAEQRLKALLQQYPQTKLRVDVEQHLREVQENLAMHDKLIGDFYCDARYSKGQGGLKGCQNRYKEIVDKYPNFSYMDEVFYRLANTYREEEEPDEAAKYYQRILRDYPNSEYLEKAREQLNIIGAAVPEADPARKNIAPAEHPGFMGNLMMQVAGKADVSVGKNGILISRDKNKDAKDLIDIAIERNGELPSNLIPAPVVQRKDPGKPKKDEPPPDPSAPPASKP